MTKRKPCSHAQARTRSSGAVVSSQVEEIARLMGEGRWRTGVTERELAARWGLTVDVVRKRSAEAFRVLARSFEDVERLRVLALTTLEALRDDARDTGDIKAAIGAVKTYADVAGLITQKIDARVEVAQLGALPPRAVLERIDEAIGRLQAMRARVLDEMKQAAALPERTGT